MCPWFDPEWHHKEGKRKFSLFVFKGAQPSAEVLAKMANALGVSSDYLTNGTSDDLAESSLTDKELLNQSKSIEKLPEADKNVVKVFLDAFITKKKLKQLVL
ncbi:MAG: helix-turn-helix domain-containing protein [Draconibacterium sp.]